MANGGKRQDILTHLMDVILPSITKANGYNTDVKFVGYGEKDPRQMTVESFPAIFITVAPERALDNITSNKYKSVLTVYFLLVCYVADDEIGLEKTNLLLEDLRHAIFSNGTRTTFNPTWDNKTVWSAWKSYEPMRHEDAAFDVTVGEFEFCYTENLI